jgi:hypothetical protein
MPIMQTIRRKNKKNAFFQDVNELFYENIVFKKMWVMDRVTNFWKGLAKKMFVHLQCGKRFLYQSNNQAHNEKRDNDNGQNHRGRCFWTIVNDFFSRHFT